jgi:hypothetical protein
MNLRSWLSRDKSLALAAAAALGIAGACADLTNPGEHRLGNPAPELAFDLSLAGGVPRGPLALENFKLIVDTVGNNDVFQREGADGYYSSTFIRYYVASGVRTAGQDPRLPALDPVPENFSTASWSQIWGPERHTEPMWDFYMRFYDMEFGTYTYSIERLATIVNGSLDALEFMIDGRVTEPDQLVPLDGTPGGYPDVDYTWPDAGRPGCVANPIPDPPPNPWYLGIITGDIITADFCMGRPWFWYDDANVPDSSVVMLNELRRGPVPQYNYVVVYKGEPPNLGPPVIRIQLGADVDTNGDPIPNAFAPFPLVADRLAALELPNVQSAPSHIAFEIRDLEPLDAGALYEVWLLNQENGNSTPAMADYFTIETIIETDEFGQQFEVDVPSEDTVRTSTFDGRPEANVRHGFIVTNETLGGPAVGQFTHVTLVKPGAAGAVTDPVLWGQFLDQSGTPDDPSDDIFITLDDLKFGELDLVDPPGSRTFRETGSGEGLVLCEASQSMYDQSTGEYLGEQCLANSSSLNFSFRRLRRPPPGYVYEVWLVGESVDPVSLGTITGPKPGFEEIDDADVVVYEAFMTDTEILRAAKVVTFEIVDLSQYAGVRITLEPKAGLATMGPTTTIAGALPPVCSVWVCGN